MSLSALLGKRTLTLPSFVHLCNTIFPHEARDTENGLLESFELFDNNLDGFISCDELRNALSVVGLTGEHDEMDVKKMIKAFDVNSHGLLDFNEFMD
ncbi:calmodulin-like protein 3 [Helianthus annuus]|uniref:calmodulin-like protein 3 n=1 Tax=Helianthus annuus TaxID=4232 RepID=UPI000B8FDF9B|nr:calmodulin-like protein 3 [Helianthus annuus]